MEGLTEPCAADGAARERQHRPHHRLPHAGHRQQLQDTGSATLRPGAKATAPAPHNRPDDTTPWMLRRYRAAVMCGESGSHHVADGAEDVLGDFVPVSVRQEQLRENDLASHAHAPAHAADHACASTEGALVCAWCTTTTALHSCFQGLRVEVRVEVRVCGELTN